jgi:hypothetical protein
MGLLPTDAEVIILSAQDNWYRIYRDGKEAYVCADYIIITETNVEMELPDPRSSTGIVPVATGEIPSYAGSIVPGEALVELSKQYIGTPYVYGGASPSGFDCSGLAYYVLKHFGLSPNRTPEALYSQGRTVSKSELEPGDIVFFANTGGTGITHVGIYAGNGQFIHSPNSRSTVSYASLTSGYWAEHYHGARRFH